MAGRIDIGGDIRQNVFRSAVHKAANVADRTLLADLVHPQERRVHGDQA